MNTQNHVLEALDTVIAWDLPEIDLVCALNDQAGLLAGDDPENIWMEQPDIP